MQLAEKLLDLFGLTYKAGCIQHTHDRKFNDGKNAVDGSTLRQLGWEQKTKFEGALVATVEWDNMFPNWFGDVEGVLTVHSVAKGDRVQPESEMESGAGLCDDVEAIVGATAGGAVASTMSPDRVLKAKLHNSVPLQGSNGAKERKASFMSEARLCSEV